MGSSTKATLPPEDDHRCAAEAQTCCKAAGSSAAEYRIEVAPTGASGQRQPSWVEAPVPGAARTATAVATAATIAVHRIRLRIDISRVVGRATLLGHSPCSLSGRTSHSLMTKSPPF